MKEIKARLTFTEDVLGTASGDKEIHSSYIAGNAPDAKTMTEEIEAIGIEGVEEKAMTVFPKDENGNPIFWDYQIRGFFKEACGNLKKCKGEAFAKASCAMKAHKKIIDGLIFVYPRKIKIIMAGETGDMQRPLRAQTMQGERVALARSETVPAGSYIDITIKCLSDDYVDAVMEWLDYGQYKGLGQWRNASWGRFSYELL